MSSSGSTIGLAVRIADYPFDPRPGASPTVATKPGPDGQTLYRVFIRLEGPDLPLIKSVTYNLHPSVTPSQVTVQRTDDRPDCMFDVWLLGTFEMWAYVIDVKDRTCTLPTHYLGYDSYFEKTKFADLGLQVAKMS